jgi:hypothetical protein
LRCRQASGWPHPAPLGKLADRQFLFQHQPVRGRRPGWEIASIASCIVGTGSGVLLLKQQPGRAEDRRHEDGKDPTGRPPAEEIVVRRTGPKSGVSIAIIGRLAANGRNFTTCTVQGRNIRRSCDESFDDQRDY